MGGKHACGRKRPTRWHDPCHCFQGSSIKVVSCWVSNNWRDRTEATRSMPLIIHQSNVSLCENCKEILIHSCPVKNVLHTLSLEISFSITRALNIIDFGLSRITTPNTIWNVFRVGFVQDRFVLLDDHVVQIQRGRIYGSGWNIGPLLRVQLVRHLKIGRFY